MHLMYSLGLMIFSLAVTGMLALVAGPGSLAAATAPLTRFSGQARGSVTPRSPFLVSPGTSIDTAATEVHWYKGNTHTHSVKADGDSTPDELAAWYREHDGYHFIVLTDHNLLTPVDVVNAAHGADGTFLVIPGEEVTDRFEKKAVHLNGLLTERLVIPQGGASIVDVLQRDTDAIRSAGGIPTINHPNYKWSITADDVKQVRGAKLLEIFSGNPDVNSMGGGNSPSVEEMWDQLLSSGHEIYGLAVDDTHELKRPWDPLAKRPGRAWVVVRSPALTAKAIVSALERGEFYASTSVVLENIAVTPQSLTITVKSSPSEKWRVQFIGRDGRVLKESLAIPASYAFTGDETYVRARVLDSNGHIAWTQPVFLTPSDSSK